MFFIKEKAHLLLFIYDFPPLVGDFSVFKAVFFFLTKKPIFEKNRSKRTNLRRLLYMLKYMLRPTTYYKIGCKATFGTVRKDMSNNTLKTNVPLVHIHLTKGVQLTPPMTDISGVYSSLVNEKNNLATQRK